MAPVAVETQTRRPRIGAADAPARPLRALVAAARPHQWTKNLLVFAGIIFAAETGDVDKWWRAIAVFAAYCAASSAAYLLNDVRDLAEDRAHPVKRSRPIAAGALSPAVALVTAAALTVLAAGLSLAGGLESLAVLAAFVALQLLYSFALKHVVLVDVLVISGLFVIRAAAGAIAVDVRLSPWLVVCTGLLALFLALGKRRGELVLVGVEAIPGRPVLAGYSLELIDQLVSVVAAATISAYSLYTFTAPTPQAMMLTIPFVVYGLFRYLYLVHQHDLGEEPDRVVVTDPHILVTALLWVAVAGTILALD
jgi:4-hydroxybenzoate polyprenyltransferase